MLIIHVYANASNIHIHTYINYKKTSVGKMNIFVQLLLVIESEIYYSMRYKEIFVFIITHIT